MVEKFIVTADTLKQRKHLKSIKGVIIDPTNQLQTNDKFMGKSVTEILMCSDRITVISKNEVLVALNKRQCLGYIPWNGNET